MPETEDFCFSPEEFCGTARVLPLPNLVLFPHVMQPLHIFESRYRDLMEDALAGDRLIVLATLSPGWEKDYDGWPPVGPIGCLSRIVACHRLETGEYNVLLVGLRRVRLLGELPVTQSFRLAEAEVCEDFCPSTEIAATSNLQRRLRNAFLRALGDLPQAQDDLEQLLSSDVPLDVLTDIIGYMLNIETERKIRLLAETDVHRRAELLLEHLAATEAESSAEERFVGFPPSFSAN